MQKKTSLRCTFSQFNDKRFHFSNGVVFLPLFHSLLKDQTIYKKNKGKKIEKYFWEEKEVLLEKENKALKQHKRLSIYHKMLTSSVECFPLEKEENFKPETKSFLKIHVTLYLKGNGLRIHV